MASTGFTLAGTGTNQTGGNVAWATPGNIVASNNTRAVAAGIIVTTQTSQWLEATNFGFAIPGGATIDGIEARFERHSSSLDARDIQDSSLLIIKGGIRSGTDKATAVNWTRNTDTNDDYGGVADLWGLTWTPGDINASNFGVALQAAAVGADDDADARVDAVWINVHYTEGSAGSFVGKVLPLRQPLIRQ